MPQCNCARRNRCCRAPIVDVFFNFGDTPVGETIEEDFLIQNSGNGTLTICEIDIPDGFTLIDPLTLPLTILAGDSDTITIRADVPSQDTFSGIVSLISCSGNTIYEFGITVRATLPLMNILGNDVAILNGDSTPNFIDDTDFGANVTGSSVSKVFTIENLGDGDLFITTPITVPTGFVCTVQPDTVVAAGDTTTFTIEVDTDDIAIYSGDIEIVNNDVSPYTFAISAEIFFEDSFARANGTIGNNWNGSTYVISSNNAVNVPTLGANLLTDGGLEGNYTAGKNDNLTLNGSPTLVQSADVHGGSKAQEFTAIAFNNRLNWPNAAGVARQWYQYSVWTKRLSGSNTGTRIRFFQTNSLPVNTVESPIIDAAYTQKKVSSLSTDTNTMFRYPAIEAAGSAPFSQVVVDDGSFNAITFSSLFAMRPLYPANGIIKMRFTTVDDTYFGIVARGDTQTSPDDFILALMKRHPSYSTTGLIEVHLLKKVNNTYSVVVASLSFTEVVNAWFELRMSGSTISMWYNNTQIGTNQTISDTEILNNGYHGLFSTGDNIITDFFFGLETDKTLAWSGSSILSNSNTYAVRIRTNALLLSDYPEYKWTFLNSARSGNNTWSNLVRLTAEVLANNPDIVIFDTANDSNEDWQNASLEAFIRRIWAFNPYIRIGVFNFFAVADQNVNANVNTPTNQLAIQSMQTLLTHYNIQLLDYWGEIKDLVNNNGHDLNEYMSDTIHPDADGHDVAYNLLFPYLPFGLSQAPLILPTYLYDDGTLENTPTRRNGNANSGETGTWATVATIGRTSSTAGSTISFNGVTCSTIGAYRSDVGSNTGLEISVDGGAYYDFTLYQNGGELQEGFGVHNITIRVKTGGSCRIEEFWAI